MPAYDYDDDDMDYSDDGGMDRMEFNTERDLDDYLNDEEYDMMILMFPQVLEYLKTNNYYGYDNLTVKLSIFDNDFDIEKAKLELSETLKQRKPAPKSIDTQTASKKTSIVNANNTDKPMSLLEKLALKKLQDKQLTAEKSTPFNDKKTTIVPNNGSNKLSLAEKLKLKRQIPSETNNENPVTLSLSEKLKLKQNTGVLNEVGSLELESTTSQATQQQKVKLSLAERLKNKKLQNPTAFKTNVDSNGEIKSTTTKLAELRISSNKIKETIRKSTAEPQFSIKKQINNKILNDREQPERGNFVVSKSINNKLSWFIDLKNQMLSSNSQDTRHKGKSNDPLLKATLEVSKIIVTEEVTPDSNEINTKDDKKFERKRKRNFKDIFSIYYPNTNIKKLAIENFNKPSPDDVIINAQKSAFQNINENIASLSLKDDGKKSVTDIESRKEDEDIDEEFQKPSEQQTIIHKYKKVTEPTKPKEKINMVSHIEEYKKHPHISFVVLGHVDAGKSTLMGRLLYDVGAVDTKLIRKLQKESEIIGKSSFHLAWVMDQTTEERERGVTVDICTSNFDTDKCAFTIVDAPGHRDFIGNAISGIAQADVAILCIDCSTDAFESGFNLDGQTKEHAIIARSLGIKHIVVAMNKLDTTDWSKQRFTEIKDQLSVFFEMIGLNVAKQISWVPCSGLLGDGVVKNKWSSPKQNWYDGPSLVQELENVAEKFVNEDENLNNAISKLEKLQPVESPFLFNILEVISSNKTNECTISGKIEQGFIQPGESITIYPSEQTCIVEQIFHQQNEHSLLKLGIEGDFVNLKLKGANSDDIHSGDLATVVGNELQNSKSFEVQLLTFDMTRPLLPGTPLIVYRGSREQPASVKKLIKTLDKNDPTKVLKKKVKHLGSHQLALVELEINSKNQDIPMLNNKENKKLSKLVIRKEGKTIGAAVVTKLT